MTKRWDLGEAVLLREHWRGKVWTARPMRVVVDTEELLVVYMKGGTVCKHPYAVGGGALGEFLPEEWVLGDRVWGDGDMVMLHEPGRWSGVKLFWSGAGEEGGRRFLRWYINLQEPLVRTGMGFDYLDQELDLVVEADKSWYWKDEEAFLRAVERGRIAGERVGMLRAEGERVLGDILAGGGEVERWARWVPPADWEVPVLGEGWEASVGIGVLKE